MSKNKGSISIIVVFLLLVGAILVSSSLYLEFQSKKISQSPTQVEPLSVPSLSPTPQISTSPIPNTTFPTPMPTRTPTSVPTTKPTPTPTPKPKAVCSISIAGVSETDSMAIKLAYSVTSPTGAYMTGAQWDYNGDNNWDTDMTQSNGLVTYKFPSNGTYTVKLHLKMSDGEVTGTCSSQVTVPQGIQVSFTGQTFKDANCNKTQEPGEIGVGGVTVNFFNMPQYTLYKTITSDSNGNFNLTVNINSQDALTLQASAIAPPYYKIDYTPPQVTLNTNQKSTNKNLPLIPAENIGLCN